jgi:signal transduction histidine kinase
MRPHPGRALALDLPLAVVVGVSAAGTAQFARRGQYGGGPDWNGQGPPFETLPADLGWPLYPSIGVIVVATAVRRLWPRAAFVGVVVGVAVFLGAGGPYGPVLVAPALAVHALANTLPFQRWAPWTLLLPPMLMAGFWDQPLLGALEPELYVAMLSGSAVLVVPAMFAMLHRNRREAERRDREQELRRYAYEERLQIARDVHDVVGHSLSVINLQAGVALHVLHKRPEEVETSLEAIRHTSQEALAELRATLAVYREPGTVGSPQHGQEEPLAPVPGLARLGDLLAALRAAGREVSLRVEGDDRSAPVPAAVDHAAYRIIQEALTNVVRHAGGASASVLLSWARDRLRLEVVDTGSSPPGSSPAGSSSADSSSVGFAAGGPVVEGGGILGMRERARAVGGTLTLSRTDGGGLRVTSELPLVTSDASYANGAG